MLKITVFDVLTKSPVFLILVGRTAFVRSFEVHFGACCQSKVWAWEYLVRQKTENPKIGSVQKYQRDTVPSRMLNNRKQETSQEKPGRRGRIKWSVNILVTFVTFVTQEIIAKVKVKSVTSKFIILTRASKLWQFHKSSDLDFYFQFILRASFQVFLSNTV